jgi:endonuclease/exonuclease/phosphatase family metal-dependent hydrolase
MPTRTPPILLAACVLILAGRVLAQEPQSPKPDLPVAPAKSHGVLRVMQFNIWQEGTSVEGGFDKIVDVVIASKADVIALSEVRNYKDTDLHTRLVAALAAKGETFYGKFGGGDVGLLSRWPIVKTEVVADGTKLDRGSIIAFHLRSDAGQEAVVCSAHLDYRNYAVYLPRGYDGNSFKMIDADGDGEPDPVTDPKQLHAMDLASARDDALKAFLGYVKEHKLEKRTVILAGDFNECSHLDWTAATRDLYSHNGVVIEWKNSKMLHKAGFRDSWRELFPDPVTHPGATWPAPAWKRDSTSWAPKVDERDRIDFIYHNGQGVKAGRAWIVGSPKYYVYNELAEPKTADSFALTKLPWPSDHKGLLVDFTVLGRSLQAEKN